MSLLRAALGREAEWHSHPSRSGTSSSAAACSATSGTPSTRCSTTSSTSFEDVWRERADLADKVEQLELDLVRHQELEGLLRTTLVSAESAAQQLREQARKEAETIVGEAHAEARAIARRASSEKERLETELRRIKSLLHSALDSLDEAAVDEREPVGEQTGEIGA